MSNQIKKIYIVNEIIKNSLNAYLRKIYLKKFPINISDDKFLKLVNYSSLNGFIKRKKPIFFFNPGKKQEIIENMENKFPEYIIKCILDAERICTHEFDLLGSGKYGLGKEIDWQTDFKSGFKWNQTEYYLGTSKYLDYLKKNISADIKVPWELSRCQHFITLGKAYWYTHEEKYAQEFVSEIESWIENNPMEFGVNWVCTMDITIRAINWIWAYYFFNDSNLSSEFRIKFLKNLFLHGRHIINNLEFRTRNNHYLSNIVGLIYLGIFFKDSHEGKEWLEKGLSALKEEMKHQVYDDGVNFESSIGYHRLATELFISATVLCIKNGITFSREYMERLEKMVEFIMYYNKPDGNSPQIGDSDDGRLHILSDYGHWNKLDHRYLLSIGASLFNRPDFIYKYPEFNEEAFWVLGENLKSFDDIKNYDIESKSFPISGYYIMRENDLYMIVDCSSPQVNSPMGHRHNSALNFELFAYGKSFIIDPGSYIYTADKKLRNLFRSTEYHNVVKVDQFQQNDYNENEIFSIGSDAKLTVNKWEITNNYDFLDAVHYGYSRIDNPVLHRRQIYFHKKKRYWLINDVLTGEGKHKFDLYFHFAPMKLEFYKEYPFAVKSDLEDENIIVVPLNKEELSAKIIDGWVSYSYGMKYKAPILKYSKHMKVPTIFTTLIYPFKNQKDLDHISKEIQIIIEEENKNEVIIE
jgi:hypothetical protein